MSIPAEYYFSKEHEWVCINGNKAKIGISDYAQQKLGDITYVELPAIGKIVNQFDVITGIESVKAASDIYTPIGGKVIAVNEELEESPELVNQSPYEDGWMIELEIDDAKEIISLMNADTYSTYIKGLE